MSDASQEREVDVAVASLSESAITELKDAVADLEAAAQALPSGEREESQRAMESIVEARRRAERHEGLLQIC